MKSTSSVVLRALPMLVSLAGCSTSSVEPNALTGRHAAQVTDEAQQMFGEALTQMDRQDWLAAERSLRTLNQRYPELSGAVLNLGIVYRETERSEMAEGAFRAALEANPQNLDAHNHLGALLRESGRFSEAETIYLAALGVAPEHSQSHLNLAILYDLYLGRLDAAKRHYRAYQGGLPQPDRRVAAWIADLERREPPADSLERAGEVTP